MLCGGAKGADELGKAWAEASGIPTRLFPAEWKKHGRAAGPIRNREMADYAEALIALWNGQSKGTLGMIELAESKGLVVHVHRLQEA